MTERHIAYSDALLDARSACVVGENVAESCGWVAGGMASVELVVYGIVDSSGSHWICLDQAVEDILYSAGDIEVVRSGGVVDLNGPIDVDHLIGLIGGVQEFSKAIGRCLDSTLV